MKSQAIDETTFIVFDVETTGLEPELGHKICEIGAMKLSGGKKVDEFWSMVNPKRPISWEAFQVNQITADMVADAPTIDEVMPDFLEFIGGSVLVAYNADFDMGFIKSELASLGYKPLRATVIDVMALAKRLMPQIRRYPLWNVAGNLSIAFPEQHRALADVEVTTKIFLHFLSVLQGSGARTVGDVLSASEPWSRFVRGMKEQKLATIRQALETGSRLRIRYLSTWKGQVTEREISPREIQGGYLVAFCHLRGEERNFRMDGILEVRMVGDGDW